MLDGSQHLGGVRQKRRVRRPAYEPERCRRQRACKGRSRLGRRQPVAFARDDERRCGDPGDGRAQVCVSQDFDAAREALLGGRWSRAERVEQITQRLLLMLVAESLQREKIAYGARMVRAQPLAEIAQQ